MPETRLHYEVTLQVGHALINDITYCAFIRTPIVKQSSFTIIQLYLPQIQARQLQSDIGRNEFPRFALNIYVYDEPDNDQMSQLYNRTLECVRIYTEDFIRFEEDRIHATLILVEPIVHYISNHNTFNRIFEDKSAPQVLDEYEDFLIDIFGGGFQFNHLYDANDYVYEQILTRSTSDISIPDYLINVYKLSNSFCYYFFDHFYIKRDATSEVVCHCISLEDVEKFKQEDVNVFLDKKMTLNPIGMRNITDINEKFQGKIGHRIINHDKEMKAFYQKEPQEVDVEKKKDPIDSPLLLIKKGIRNPCRQVQIMFEKGFSTSEVVSSATSTIYSPDDVDLGTERYENAKGMMENMLGFYQYEVSNCIPDFIQFGYSYNLEQDNPYAYVYTPISIVNIFARKNQKEHWMYHLTKSQFIRYKGKG